jgi:GAF domain-containing protein/HAMP domain-containing protein
LNKVIERQFETALRELAQQRLLSRNIVITAFVLALILGSVTFIIFGRDLSQRVDRLVEAAGKLESGNLQTRIDTVGEDEFSQLGRSMNAVAIQLDALIGGLEQRVAERTRDLSMTAEIGRLVVELRDPRELMNEIVELIRERFGFYHAQVFIVDDESSRANLVASTGGAGRQLLARGHYLTVGTQSVIGQVTSTAEPVVALDTDTDQVHRRNELLPDTRSEMALPMRIGSRVIGALDVQSVAPNAFDDDDVAVFQIIADQLAIALDNARLYNELQDVSTRIKSMESQATIEAWQAYAASRPAPALSLNYLLEEENIQPHEGAPSSTILQAVQRGELVRANDDDIDLAIPIKVRGEVIGVFGFGGPTLADLSEDDLALVEAVIERVGLALENLRLLEGAARRADHERVVNEISSKIAGSTDVNHILQTAVKELGRVLHAPQTSVQLRQQDMDG